MQINNLNYMSNINKTTFKASLLDIMQKPQAQASATSSQTIPSGYAPVDTPIANLYNTKFGAGNLLTQLMPTHIASQSINNDLKTPKLEGYKNNLRSMFQNNQVVMYAMVPRTFNAKDTNGNGLIEEGEQGGTFLNMIDRFDELKSYGINTIHWLPINPPGIEAAKGSAGSVYAPADYLSIDPKLDDPSNPKSVKEEAKEAINEAHKRGIKIMVDLPSCMSVDLYKNRINDLSAVDAEGNPKTPEGWEDIRMFEPWADKDKRILNPALIEYHKKFIDMCIDMGIDGIRADVARAKPPEFWDIIIPYARSKDPEFAFLAETYTYEDASPMKNMPADRPEECLKAGFDSYYGQFHIFPIWKAKDFHKFITDNLIMANEEGMPKGKSIIGSFATHDDPSPMSNGGVDYCMLTNIAQMTLPMTNPYMVSGYESGDRYIYPYGDKLLDITFKELMEKPLYKYQAIPRILDTANNESLQKIQQELKLKGDIFHVQQLKELMASPKANMKLEELAKDDEFKNVIKVLQNYPLTKDNIKHYTHNEYLDIFNESRRPGGENPEIGEDFGNLAEFRIKNYDVIGALDSSYIPLHVKGDPRDEVIAYARHNHGKTFVVIMNKNVHARNKVKVMVPGLKADQKLINLAEDYGQKSEWKAKDGAIEIDLGTARGHIFEIDDPNIEQLVGPENVYKQIDNYKHKKMAA